MRALNRIGYDGPLSVEWEDVGLDRETAAPEALRFVKSLSAEASARQFDAAFSSQP
jgi:sugar phosphate isomerase/epimerase